MHSSVERGLAPIVRYFGETADRRLFHERIVPVIEDLCLNKQFIFEVIRNALSRPNYLQSINSLALPIYELGDLVCTIHLFVPLRDGGRYITHDNIHHHGWRMLTSAVLSGGGYETITFRRRSHMDRQNGAVQLQIDEMFLHSKEKVQFLDSHTAHVVFHPSQTCSTFAVWSADQKLINQSIKEKLKYFPRLRHRAAQCAHALRLGDFLGLNATNGVYFHPQGGRIVVTENYTKPFDGSNKEILHCVMRFLQQVGFDDAKFLQSLKTNVTGEAQVLIEMLIKGLPIPDIGVWGDQRRRFSRTQILQALDHSVPPDNANK